VTVDIILSGPLRQYSRWRTGAQGLFPQTVAPRPASSHGRGRARENTVACRHRSLPGLIWFALSCSAIDVRAAQPSKPKLYIRGLFYLDPGLSTHLDVPAESRLRCLSPLMQHATNRDSSGRCFMRASSLRASLPAMPINNPPLRAKSLSSSCYSELYPNILSLGQAPSSLGKAFIGKGYPTCSHAKKE
jgi:hypothetical protein